MTVAPFIRTVVNVKRALILAGVVGITAAVVVDTHNKTNTKAKINDKEAVRDSFNQSAKQFDKMNTRVESGKATWTGILDSLKVDQKYKQAFVEGRNTVLDSLKKVR